MLSPWSCAWLSISSVRGYSPASALPYPSFFDVVQGVLPPSTPAIFLKGNLLLGIELSSISVGENVMETQTAIVVDIVSRWMVRANVRVAGRGACAQWFYMGYGLDESRLLSCPSSLRKQADLPAVRSGSSLGSFKTSLTSVRLLVSVAPTNPPL